MADQKILQATRHVGAGHEYSSRILGLAARQMDTGAMSCRACRGALLMHNPGSYR